MTVLKKMALFQLRAPFRTTCLAAAGVLAAAGIAPPSLAANEGAWLLRSGSLAVSERSLVMALSVKSKELSAADARRRADQQLASLRERLVLAAAAVRAGLDTSPAVVAAIEQFRFEHLVDIFLEEKTVRPAREVAGEQGRNREVWLKRFRDERAARYQRLVEQVAVEFPATVDEAALGAALPGGEGDPVVGRLLGKEVRAGQVRRELARVDHPSNSPMSELQVARTVLDDQLAKIRFAAVAEREGFAARADFVDDLADRRLRILANAFAEHAVYPGVQIVKGQVEAWYETNRESLRRGEEREIFEILVAGRAEAEAAAASLAAGADFAETVRARSIGPTREQGGRVGFVGKGDILPGLEKAALKLRAGETSPPVRSPYGWHIFRCAQVVSGRIPPLEELRPRIEAQVLNELKSKALAGELARIAPEHPAEFNQKRYEEILKSL